MLPPVITLTTDFGLDDPYVGQMKGTILRQNSGARIIDLSHAVPAQDILAAAAILRSSFQFFPPGAVHLAVVDPGVGTSRRILAAASAEQFFIAPDNGLLSLLFADQIIQRVHLLANPLLFAANISPTFHGRDIMASAAALLAGGFPFVEVGPLASAGDCVQLAFPKPGIAQDRLTGQVLHIDHFGNLRVNITQAELERFAPLAAISAQIKGQLAPLRRTYADAKPGGLLALIDSSGWLELAVSMGSAARLLACGTGESVTVLRQQEGRKSF